MPLCTGNFTTANEAVTASARPLIAKALDLLVLIVLNEIINTKRKKMNTRINNPLPDVTRRIPIGVDVSTTSK